MSALRSTLFLDLGNRTHGNSIPLEDLAGVGGLHVIRLPMRKTLAAIEKAIGMIAIQGR